MISIETSQTGRIIIIHVAGILESDNVALFSSAFSDEIYDGSPALVLDLSALDDIDHDGLRVLYAALKRARHAGGDLRLAHVQESVWNSLVASRLDEIFRSYSSLTEAMSSY